MHKLFVRIFLWFWLAVTLIGAILVAVSLTTETREAEMNRQRHRFAPFGPRLMAAYETGGRAALAALIFRIEEEENVRLFLFRGNSGPLSGRPMPRRFMRHMHMHRMPGGTAPIPEPPPGPFGRVALPLVIELAGGYTMFVHVPPPSRLELLLNPRALALRLLVTFLVAGIVCYLLARSVTAPITTLRRATRELAAGNLAVRVGQQLGGRDELAELGRDFDRMAERIESLLNAQQRLLRDISHELRSPLARLHVALELARQRGDAAARPHLDRMEKEAERLNELIGQLLTITRLEARSVINDPQPVALERLLEQIVQDADFEARSQKRGVSLSVAGPLVLPGTPELLHRALENVVRNGVWYTPEGTTVEVALDRPVGMPNFARITMRDHGPGVPEDELGRLFRPFYRVGDARDRQRGGAGVGLAIAERAVQLHGGTISATNHPEGGLLVTVLLPASQAGS